VADLVDDIRNSTIAFAEDLLAQETSVTTTRNSYNWWLSSWEAFLLVELPFELQVQCTIGHLLTQDMDV
jgi:hypothetical protein